MIKLFISQPMYGKTNDEIIRVREKAIESAKHRCKEGEPVEVIDSFFEDYNPGSGCIPLKYLSKSIGLLADADVAYFVEGWQDARGCRIEHECALQYGIEIIEDC